MEGSGYFMLVGGDRQGGARYQVSRRQWNTS